MKNNQCIDSSVRIDDSYTEKWFSEEFALVTGLYHLTYDGQWHCMFASDDCFQILKCTSSDFLENLQNLVSFTVYKARPKTVGEIFQEIIAGQETRSFISIRPWENEFQYIKGTLSVSYGQNGLLCVYGQITDVSEECARDVQFQSITEEYEQYHLQLLDKAGLLQAAKMVFPEIFSMNLTKGTCRMIQYYSATTLGTLKEGPLEQMMLFRLENIAPEDQQTFKNNFFPDGQLKAIQEGKERIQFTYRQCGTDGIWHWMESIVMHQENPYNDDILTFAVSRNVDKQKEEEEQLRQKLESTSEQLEDWLYYNKLSSDAFPGLVYVHHHGRRETPYAAGYLAETLGCPPDMLVMGDGSHIHPEDRDAVRLAREKAEQEGAESFHAEYRVENGRGGWAYISNHVVNFTDKNGKHGHIHYLHDITYEHELTEKLRLHMEKQMAATENIFNLVAQHSERILYKYDIKSRTTSPWNEENRKKDILAHVYENNYSNEALDYNQAVLPDCKFAVKRFFADIHNGEPSGEVNVHLRLLDGQLRWYHFQYSALYDGGQPATVLISIADVTERHEQEIAYYRHAQSLAFEADGYLMYIESDLTADRIEKLAGLLLVEEDRDFQCSHSDFGRLMLDLKFQFQKPEEASEYFSCTNLFQLYAQGVRSDQTKWQVCFSDSLVHWLSIETELMADPYNGHIKAFFRMRDITREQEEQLAVIQRADYDAMTGLLRKDEGEKKIRQHLAEGNEKGGILLILDLDDLKGINDTLGHSGGDEAIRGISETLKGHFRSDDILIRAGGDEFIVYLPGAGKNVSSVQLYMASLLRKLSSIAIGQNQERFIHCSVGCAIEEPGIDTYESLFQRADLALYHVKRHGKNNFAFFEPKMLQENYEFKHKQAASVMSTAAREEDLQHLLEITAITFPGIVQFNLTKDCYQILSAGSYAETVPDSGTIDRFWQSGEDKIHPDDRTDTLSALSKKSLLALYAKGQRSRRHYFRSLNSGNYARTEVIVSFYLTGTGDICTFVFFRWDLAPERELEIMRLQKLLEMSSPVDFEYVCLIDVHRKSYTTFSRDGRNSHTVPENAEFDTVTKHIRDTQIPPEERDAYYEKADLKNVLQYMNGTERQYSYQYTMIDGITREAVFSWYEDSHSELMMTVRMLI